MWPVIIRIQDTETNHKTLSNPKSVKLFTRYHMQTNTHAHEKHYFILWVFK